MLLESTSKESDEHPIVDRQIQATLSDSIAHKRTKACRIFRSSRSRRVSLVEKFRAQYDISDYVWVIFPENNPDDLRSTMNSFSGKIFFTYEQF